MHLPGLIVLLLASIIAATTIDQRDTNCNVCIQLFNFCVENGYTPGQGGCKKTCAEHVCHLFRHEGNECKDCGEVFSVCAGKPRY